MKYSDKKLLLNLNTDDSPENLPPGDVSDALNIRMGSSDEEHGRGNAETLQGEIEVLLGVSAPITYYGAAIGGEFIYEGFDEVQIGDQVWMKRNYDAEYPGSKAYDDNETNVPTYGRLYTHEQIMQTDFCPAGWRVPTEADIDELLAYLGGEMVAGGKLKEFDISHWRSPNTGSSDEFGFRALPGGKFDTAFSLLQSFGLLWLADDAEPVAPIALNGSNITGITFKANWTAVIGANGYYLDVAEDAAFTSLVAGYDNLDVGNVIKYDVSGLDGDTYYFYRVRAYNEVGASGNSNIVYLKTLVSDIDGNVYTSVIIGTQEWFIENYKLNYPGSVVYNNDEANRADYGGMYSFASLGLMSLPAGWRIPSEADIDTLLAYIGVDNSGGKLKETGLSHWLTPNIGAIDSYGFRGRGGGYWHSGIDVFYDLKWVGFYWTTTDVDVDLAVGYALEADSVLLTKTNTNKIFYLPIRLMRDVT